MSTLPPLGGVPLHLVEREVAETTINEKWNQLGGLPGVSVTASGPPGLVVSPGGHFRPYVNGAIYRGRSGVAFYVNEIANRRYTALGGPGSFLGWPTSDDVPDPEVAGSGLTNFENGTIYWWPDIGAFEMHEVVLRYVGFHCFGETDEISASDEPYITFGVVPILTDKIATVPTKIYEDVNAGQSRGDQIELYRGLPFGLALSVTLAEHDEGDPNKFREHVKGGVEKTGEKIDEAITKAPAVGSVLGPIVGIALAIAGPTLTDLVNGLLGTGDDHIGTTHMVLTVKDMLQLANSDRRDFEGIMAHLESPLISGDGASYKIYFDFGRI